jgi:hypothetical protein
MIVDRNDLIRVGTTRDPETGSRGSAAAAGAATAATAG